MSGGSTSTAQLSFDVFGFKVKRFQIFHSGSSPSTDVSLDNRNPNYSASFDPRSIVVEYKNIPGSNNFTTRSRSIRGSNSTNRLRSEDYI